MQHAEEIIIQQLKQGNENAYKHIFEHHYVLLCYVANEYVKDKFLAETIAGDVIFHLWEIRDALEISSIRSYLMRAVRNRAINYLKLKRERYEVPFSALPLDLLPEEKFIQPDSYPLGLLLERELEDQINQAIANLPLDCQRVFKMSRFEEKKYETIGQELNISVNTVKYHMKNALASLRKDLGAYLTILLLLFL